MRLFGRSTVSGFGRSTPSSSRPSSPGPQSKEVQVRIHVPQYGCMFMTSERDDSHEYSPHTSIAPTYTARDLTGELEVEVPRGMGRRKCRAIKLTLRSVCRLNMGGKRGWETDVLFQRSIEIKGAITLEEGVQRFTFTIIVPYSLSPYDVHPFGDVRCYLHAELIGLSSCTADEVHVLNERRDSDPDVPPEFGIVPNMTVSWSQPVAAGGDEVQWLKDTVSSTRCIGLLYNPEPNNGVTVLDETARAAVDGLGPVEIRYMSDVWSVAALLKTFLTFPSPSPALTVYYTAVSLQQKAVATSPRDPKGSEPVVRMTPFLVWSKGTRPPPGQVSNKAPAIWRGQLAGGKDHTEIVMNGIGRLPNDETGRPSSLEGIVSPIQVSHQLAVEVWYTVKGEDARGNPLPLGSNQTGNMRVMRHTLDTVVPSCCCIPEALALPSYESLKIDGKPCQFCKLPAAEQACRNCLTSVPHARHDLPHELVGNTNGSCPLCVRRYLTTDDGQNKWVDCACGFSVKELEARMQTVIPDDYATILTRACPPPPKSY